MSIDKNNLISLFFQVKSRRELRIENWELRMKKQSLRDGTIENWELRIEKTILYYSDPDRSERRNLSG